MSLLVVGLSHRSTTVEALERAALDADAVGKLLDDVHSSAHVSEAVVLATCNRVEFYADAATFHGGVDEASALLARYAGVGLEELKSELYVHYGERAVAHLFQVAAGLDSMVVGESQILGQVRDAFRLAQTSGTTGRVLGELFQQALRVGKRVHAETGIDAAGRSLVTVGLAALAPAGVRGLSSVVVGAGSMAALAATTLARNGAQVIVANRTEDRAVRLAESVGGTAISMRNVPDVLSSADLLVACTGAASVVVPYEMVAAAQPLLVLDLALPRDVDPAVRELPGVRLADISTLADRGEAAPAAADVEDVRGIVAEELAGYSAARRQSQVAPTVVALRAMADDVVDAELARMHGRLPDLGERARAEVAATVRRVVDKLLHAPTVRVKELAAEPDGAAYESALRELFALDRKTVEAVTQPSSSTTSVDHGRFVDSGELEPRKARDQRERGGAG
ncbi:MAG TPA: glutamyl-tRNA reductase [Jiangellaceae bacterium]